MATTNYEDALDAITFGITSLTSHNNDNDIRSSLSSGLKSSLSSSSSTSSTSSAAASSSSTGSANHTGFHGKPKNAGPARALQQQVKHQNGNSVTDTANDLTCPLCKKTLASPKVLNCLHAFCKQCLVIEMQTVSEFGDYNPSFINCPKCKQETMVTEGVDSLQDDYIIHNMLDMTAIQQAIQDCTSCDTSEKAEARCADCAQFLCSGCIKAHQTMRCFQGHQVVKFEEIKKSYERNLSENLGKSFDFGVPIHKPLFCKVHTKESLKFFCNTCQVPICSECVVNVHMQPMHQYERLGEAEAKNIEELEQLIESAKERIVECNGDLSQTLDQYYSRLQEKQEQTRSCIEETHATYKAILEKRKEDLMKELEEKHSQKELLVSDMHNNIEKSISQLNDLIDFVKRCLKNGNCSEILMLKSLIVNQLRHLTNNLPAVHNLDINLKFYKDQNLFQKAVLETYGRFVTDKEHKQRMLNSLTADRNLNVPDQQKQHQMQQMIQLQKQMELQKQQEWFMANMIKSQHSQTANQQQRIEKQPSVNSLGSPTTSLTDDWIRNIIKTGSQLDEQNVNHQFNMENQLRTSLSPQSSNSSNTNSNPWANSGQMNSLQQQQLMQNKQSNGDKYQLSLAQQQLMLANLQQSTYNSVPKQIARSNSPIHFQNMPNLNVFQQQQSNQQISRSNTPSNFVLSNQMANGASMIQHQDAEEFIPFGANSNRSTNCMTQNFNQLSKMMGGNMNDTTLVSNISELGFNQSTAGFSDIQTNDPSMSPTAQQLTSAIGTIGSAINPSVGGESTFAGNGNLNPPVRQSVKMTNMQIRTKFGTLGSGKTQFNSPHGFCLGIDEEIIIADTNNHRIQVFDKNGEYKYSFGSPGREEGQVWHPRKVTVMRDTGNIVICDRGNERSRMQIFTRTGKFVKKISIRYIDIVAGLAIAESGDIVAVDSVSPTVFRISEAGDLIKWFDCSDNMREPSDIAIKGHEYFICDFKGHCITVFSEDGAFLRRIGGENITNFPNGIDISDAGDVLVGDSHGNRFHVAVFTREGTMLNEFECPYVKVSRCCGLKITSEGYVVTLAKNNHHVLVLNTLYVS